MKKCVLVFLLWFSVFGVCKAQEQENAWNGTVRFNPVDIFINLHNAIPGIYVTWTPYILPNLGIPAKLT
jgi:fumarate reductase subunit C